VKRKKYEKEDNRENRRGRQKNNKWADNMINEGAFGAADTDTEAHNGRKQDMCFAEFLLALFSFLSSCKNGWIHA